VVASEQDLQGLLALCERRDVETAVRGLGLEIPIGQPNLPMSVTGR
jgi:hypothetical protein